MSSHKKYGSMAAISLAAALVLTGCGGNAGADAEADTGPIKIGLVTSLTGPYSTLGEGNLAGAEIAVKQVNDAGGVDGRQLELVYRDDKSQADQSVIGFNELAADQDIVAVLGSTDSTSSTAVAPAAQRAKIPYVALSPVTAIASGDNPYAFITPSTTRNYAQAVVDYWVAEGFKDIAIAYDAQDIFGKSGFESTKELAQAAGLNLVLEESFDPTSTDFTALITHLKDSSADAVMVWNAGPAAVIITKQFAATGSDTQLFMSGAQGSNLYLEPAGAAAEGVIVAAGIAVGGQELPDGDLAKVIGTVADPYEAEHGSYPTEFVFNGASGVYLLTEAIRGAGSTDRTALRDSFEQLEYLAPTGPYKYSAQDHGGLGADAISILEVKDGAFTTTDYQKDIFATDGVPQ